MTSKNTVDSPKFEPENLPRHIAIIMDGNGRWAKSRGLPRVAGHREGVKAVRRIVELCGEMNIDALTLYTFSTENWRRPADEVSALMKLLLMTLRKEINDLMKNNVRLRILGDLDRLPPDAAKAMRDGVVKTSANTGLSLNLALNYGSRQEMIHAVRSIAGKVKDGSLSLDDINEDVFSDALYTAGLPDPDLLIRTSGELRLSNFLLWQLAYTELYATPVFWPDFKKADLLKAINAFQDRERRFGLVGDQVTQGR
ncbi:isoprenyl transferase [bacterium]|nr:isoprenyl transferase [bacterium]